MEEPVETHAFAPGTSDGCMSAHAVPLGAMELLRGILLPLESLRDFFSYLLLQSERAI